MSNTREILLELAPPEPQSLRVELAVRASDDWSLHAPEVLRRLVDELRPAWDGPLATTGVAEPPWALVTEGARREIWLWVMGERTWRHLLEVLAGRLERRA